MKLQFEEWAARWVGIANHFEVSIRTIQGAEVGLPVDYGPVLVLEGKGADHGMVLLQPETAERLNLDELIEPGFGYSVVDVGTLDTVEDREATKEMLIDWGYEP